MFWLVGSMPPCAGAFCCRRDHQAKTLDALAQFCAEPGTRVVDQTKYAIVTWAKSTRKEEEPRKVVSWEENGRMEGWQPRRQAGRGCAWHSRHSRRHTRVTRTLCVLVVTTSTTGPPPACREQGQPAGLHRRRHRVGAVPQVEALRRQEHDDRQGRLRGLRGSAQHRYHHTQCSVTPRATN